jgi:hypothetical protein
MGVSVVFAVAGLFIWVQYKIVQNSIGAFETCIFNENWLKNAESRTNFA